MSEKNKIEIDQSSLLSLKTELLRKKAEALASQPSTTPKIKDVAKKKISSEPVKKEKDCKVFEHDDHSSNEKVKRILEAKAKYYDRMQSSGQNTSLILFQNKPPPPRPARSAPTTTTTFGDDDYVEFTDGFGRTRNVRRKEFEALKRQQEEDDDDGYGPIEEVRPPPPPEEEIGESFLKQRDAWREQEKINSEQSEVFYQDLLFDEAREHGTAFYGFSTDHSERQQQQKLFKQMRTETEKAQSQRQSLKKQRDDIIKNRVKNAKARMRQKLGLPPEPEEKTSEQQNDDEASTQPPAEKVDEKEIERERLRKEHIRPWDRDKKRGYPGGEREDDSDDDDSTEWAPTREKILMTQDEWVEKQRGMRVNDFAPIYNSASSSSASTFRSPNVEHDVMANLKYIRKKFE